MVNKLLSIINYKQKDKLSLQKELMNMLRDYFNLRIQLKMGQLKKTHLLIQVRRNIAFIKYCLSQNKNIL